MTPNDAQLQHQITSQVSQALAEDIGSGDITAQLIPSDESIRANATRRSRIRGD